MSKKKPTNNTKSKKATTDATNISIENEEKLMSEKKLKVQQLEEEIKFLKKKLNSSKRNALLQAHPVKILEEEINNLEIDILKQTSQLYRLEDKYNMLKKAYRAVSLELKQSHTDAMDYEELILMAKKIDISKTELAARRNLVKEMQQTGLTNLPAKVVDETKKTQIELNYIQSTIQKTKRETEEAELELKVSLDELAKIEEEYQTIKQNNLKLEEEIDEITFETELLIQQIPSREKEALDLQKALAEIGPDKTIEKNDKITVKNEEEEEEEEEEVMKQKKKLSLTRKEKKIRNKDIEDLKTNFFFLQKELYVAEKKLRETKQFKNEIAKQKRNKNYNLKDLVQEYEITMKEIESLKVMVLFETREKTHYLNILEDAMGKLKVMCRFRGDIENTTIEIVNEKHLSIHTPKENYEFFVDQCFENNSSNDDIFESLSRLYMMANEGYNCYVVVMGGAQSGRSFSTIGQKENGLIWIGLNKIKSMISENKKNNYSTKMSVCSVEMNDHNIFDLIEGKLNDKIDIKMDAFRMSVLCYAKYKDCFSDMEIKNCLRKAIKNRQQAAEDLKSTDTTFVFLVTFQVFNKTQHRYWKGKLTYVKLATFKSMKSLNNELKDLVSGSLMDYQKTKICQLLEDCFGGESKTCVIGTINPSVKHLSENVEILKLMSNFKTVTNSISKNSDSPEIFLLKNNIERLLRGLKPEQMTKGILF